MWLVSFCVSRINIVPSSVSGDRISPREKFIGRKLDYQRDLRVGFGDYVQAHEPNIISQVVRTEGAIALLPVGNLTGSVKFFKLATRSIVTRDMFTVLPMPDNVIAYLNMYAGNQQRKLQRDPAITYRGRAVEDHNEDEPLVEARPTHFVPADTPVEEAPEELNDQPERITRQHVSRERVLDRVAHDHTFDQPLRPQPAAQLGGADDGYVEVQADQEQNLVGVDTLSDNGSDAATEYSHHSFDHGEQAHPGNTGDEKDRVIYEPTPPPDDEYDTERGENDVVIGGVNFGPPDSDEETTAGEELQQNSRASVRDRLQEARNA
jgi:hypothetical protein